jgi:hypothetical protein
MRDAVSGQREKSLASIRTWLGTGEHVWKCVITPSVPWNVPNIPNNLSPSSDVPASAGLPS